MENLHLAQDNVVQFHSAVKENVVRILLADDHGLVRETIAAFLEAEGLTEVRTVSSLDEAMDVVAAAGPFDLVLLDYNMPGMNGLEGLTRMIAANEDNPVALLSGTASPAIAEAALETGAAGFVPKTLASKSMVSAVHFMVSGEIYAPFEFMKGEDPAAKANLSKRETDVLSGICEGKSNKEIARDLDLQEVTVKLHVKTLSRKLGARNRTHAAMIARDRTII